MEQNLNAQDNHWKYTEAYGEPYHLSELRYWMGWNYAKIDFEIVETKIDLG